MMSRQGSPATPLPSFPNSGGEHDQTARPARPLKVTRWRLERRIARTGKPYGLSRNLWRSGRYANPARPGSKAGSSHPRRRRAGPASRRTWTAASPPASQGRVRRDHPGRCRAAGGICARAARPARGRPDARFRRRARRLAGTGNAALRQAGRAYAPHPRAGQTKHHRRPPPGWRTVAREISSSMSVACRTTDW